MESRRRIDDKSTKICPLEHNSTASKIVTTKWIKVNNLLAVQYSTNKNIIFKTPMLRSELCDYSNVYIVANDQTDHGALKLSATHYKQKTEIFLVTRQRTC